MLEIYNLLPNIVIYIVLGYIFLRVFRTVRIVKNPDNYEHILTESLVLGFIIKSIAALIPFSFGYRLDIIGLSISSAIAGFLFAKLLSSKIMLDIIDKLQIKHTKFKYMWQNIEDPEFAVFVDITNPDTKSRYFGQLVMYEEFERSPIIQICKYMSWSGETLLYDFSEDPTRTVLIDTSKYTEIDIVYQKVSNVIKRWSSSEK